MAQASRDAAGALSDASRSAAAAAQGAASDLSMRMTEWKLNASDIEADLAAKRDIVRTKTVSAGAPTGNVDANTIENAIKGRLKADSQLSDLKFDVNANRKGEVELEGKARSANEVARAMACALDTEGVAKVTSKIKLDADAGSKRMPR